jgi:hypothetical protein
MTITESSAPRIRLTSQLFAGLLIAALGVLFTLDNLQIIRARDVLRRIDLDCVRGRSTR